MFEERIVERPAFNVVARKAWITLEAPENFVLLMREAEENGLIDKLKGYSAEYTNSADGMDGVTKSSFLGVAIMTIDGMDYYLSAEVPEGISDADLETLTIPAARWAIIKGEGASLADVSALEQYSYGEWLQTSGCALTDAPQMNVFFVGGAEEYTELWLPIIIVSEIRA